MITIYYESKEFLILQALLNVLVFRNIPQYVYFNNFLTLEETCCNERKINSKLKIFPSSIQTVSHLTHCNGHA